MKLQNKKTGQLGNFIINKDHFECVDLDYVPEYRNLAELNAEWEDYEEPEEFWYINECGDVLKYKYDGGCSCPILEAKKIGNHFKTKEEAEKAVEKLKALERLKDKGFRFDGWLFFPDSYHPTQERIRDGRILFKVKNDKEVGELLDTVFGGEE